MTQGFGGFILLLGAGWGCDCGAGCRAGGGPSVRMCPFLSPNHDENQILNSIKTEVS